jgi:hypothetical protein
MNTKATDVRVAVTTCRRTSAPRRIDGRERSEARVPWNLPRGAQPPHRGRAGVVATLSQVSA